MISIVTSTYNSSKYIELFFEKIQKQVKSLNVEYEIIVVDDGSTDNTVEILKKYSAKNNHLKIIELSNNFGQIASIFCGLKHSNGEQIFITDSDIEETEDNLIRFYNEYMKDTSFDMIYGVINKKEGYTLSSKYLSKIFNNIIYLITNKKIDKDQSWTRIISKRLSKELLKYKEIESYPAGLFNLVGFKQKKMNINKKYKGYSSYSFLKKFKLALNICTNFSSLPLIFICLVGLFVSLVSFIFILIIFFSKLFIGFSSGWASLIIFIGFIGGINILSVGVVGIYISRIFNQVKNRPQYIIKEKINFE
jgi:putative glycosyltransferase